MIYYFNFPVNRTSETVLELEQYVTPTKTPQGPPVITETPSVNDLDLLK